MVDSAAPTRRREGGTLAPVKTKDAWREPSPLHIGDVDMRRWTIRILVALFGLIVVTALTGATYQWLATRQDLAATPPPGQLIDIGGYRLHLWCTGNGAPVVVLDAGLGGTSAGWGFVQPEVARFTRVCSYDRAGMGYSDPGPSPRTARRIANELAELLARDGIAGPVVLAGESIAGFNVRLFASDHPERTAGLVLVDASHEDDTHEVPGMARFVRSCRRWVFFDCLACRSARESSRWLHPCGDTRRQQAFAERDTGRRPTRSFTFGRPCRK
jgi:hypothetical protein